MKPVFHRLYLIYFAVSVVILTAVPFFSSSLFWQRPDNNMSQDIPLRWNEIVILFLDALSPFAICGLCAFLVFLTTKRRTKRKFYRSEVTFLIAAVFFGLIGILMANISGMLAHMDCSNQCVAEVPSTLLYSISTFVATVVGFGMPLTMLIFYFVLLPKRVRETSKKVQVK